MCLGVFEMDMRFEVHPEEKLSVGKSGKKDEKNSSGNISIK